MPPAGAKSSARRSKHDPRPDLARSDLFRRLQTRLDRTRFDRRPDPGGHRRSRADGHRTAGGPSAGVGLLRLSGGRSGLCPAGREPAPVLGRGLHHRADLRGGPGDPGGGGHAPLRGSGGGAGDHGGSLGLRGGSMPHGLGRRSLIHPGHDGIPCRDRPSYPVFPIAGRHGPRQSWGRDPASAPLSRHRGAPRQPLQRGPRARGAGDYRPWRAGLASGAERAGGVGSRHTCGRRPAS